MNEETNRSRISRRKALGRILIAGGIVSGLVVAYNHGEEVLEKIAERVGEKIYSHGPVKLESLTIGEQDYKILGVAHMPEYVRDHREILSELIKDCSVLVSEHNPELSDSSSRTKISRDYLKLLQELCKEYDKPIIHLDPDNLASTSVDVVSGLLSSYFALLGVTDEARRILNKEPKEKQVRKLSRTFFAGYISVSSFMGEAVHFPIKCLGINSRAIDFLSYGKFDYRNCTVAERVEKLPQLLKKSDLERGKYILVEMGDSHLSGLSYYLRHPQVRGFKRALYYPTFSAVSTGQIARFDAEGDDWRKTVLDQ